MSDETMEPIKAWAKVESSNLDAVRWSPGKDKWGVLLVRFKSGATWAYGATRERYDGLMAAESKGRYFAEHIKPLQAWPVEEDV